MVALASVFVAVIVSLLIARVATVAFVLTGLSTEAARFQARSALSGTGFTTTEAESVVGHPVRRRIVMSLMLVGSAGLVTVVATLMLSFTDTGGRQAVLRLVLLLGGLTLVWLLARSRWVERRLAWGIAKVLQRWTELDARDYGALLHLSESFAVGEIAVRDGDWLTGGRLDELELREEGVVVLGITLPDGTWLGSPPFDTRIGNGDRVIAYGPGDRLTELDRRRAGEEGDAEHRRAAEAHRRQVEALADEHLDDA